MFDELRDDLGMEYNTAFQGETGGTPASPHMAGGSLEQILRRVRHLTRAVGYRRSNEVGNGVPVLRRDVRGVVGDGGGHRVPLYLLLVVIASVTCFVGDEKPVLTTVRHHRQPRAPSYA